MGPLAWKHDTRSFRRCAKWSNFVEISMPLNPPTEIVITGVCEGRLQVRAGLFETSYVRMQICNWGSDPKMLENDTSESERQPAFRS